jgi:hypothetical protein
MRSITFPRVLVALTFLAMCGDLVATSLDAADFHEAKRWVYESLGSLKVLSPISFIYLADFPRASGLTISFLIVAFYVAGLMPIAYAVGWLLATLAKRFGAVIVSIGYLLYSFVSFAGFFYLRLYPWH